MSSVLDGIVSERDCVLDENGIFVSRRAIPADLDTSKKAWERIYNFDREKLEKDRAAFDRDKLADHLRYIEGAHKFTSETRYLEIGCGPAHIGDYLQRTYGLTFVGVDFNYRILLSLKEHFERKGYRKFVLIHGDINSMPLLDDSVDFVYGGGVIEHFPDTNHILAELKRVLRPGGCSFNTVPALSLWWLLRFYNSIPSLPVVRGLFEYLHARVFDNKILVRNFGYELSFTICELRRLHERHGFAEVTAGPFAFHLSEDRIGSGFARRFLYSLHQNRMAAAMYFVRGYKR